MGVQGDAPAPSSTEKLTRQFLDSLKYYKEGRHKDAVGGFKFWYASVFYLAIEPILLIIITSLAAKGEHESSYRDSPQRCAQNL